MSNSLASAKKFAETNRERFLEELGEYLSLPSISTDPERKEDVRRAADWTADKLRSVGLKDVRVLPTPGHPVVFGELNHAGKTAPNVLIYGHYDVQPADPLDLWQSDPFTATVRGENLYARGATDMKGQLMAAIYALESVLQNGNLPFNVKFLVEGEEEIGSSNLGDFIRNNEDLLACDVLLNPDTGMLAADLPTITYALRGLVYFEIRLYGPDHDLHSGSYGGVVHNPAQVLCELIANMHDEQGRVTLPGFYENVRGLSTEERQELARLPVDEQFYLARTGVPALWGETGFTPGERVGARPTLEVNGLYSGFIEEGQKTVLPAWSMAKISCRLVSDQDPEEIHQKLLQYMQANAPRTVRYEVKKLSGSLPALSERQSPYVEAIAKAYEAVWGKRPLYRREGGTIPVIAMVQEYLGVEAVNSGFSLPDDNLHAPNEKVHLPTLYRGIEALIHFFENLSQINAEQ